MKLFIAGLDTETNTFSPIPTGYEAFAECCLAHGDATRRPLNCCSTQLSVWRQLAEERGWTVIESLCAVAEPGGRTTRSVYEGFRAEIMHDLRAADKVDAVLLALHGACVAEGYDDVEGDLLENVRGLVGRETPIGAELDLHCHITARMVANATALVAYKEYPHTDIGTRARELFELIADAAGGRTRPRMGLFDCRMLSTFRTQEQPLRGFVDRMMGLEGRDGVLSVSFGHGFPWGDVEEVGARMLVITDGDQTNATALAESLGRELFARRHELAPRFFDIDEALDCAATMTAGPVVLADVADNPGGGAPGDSTFILRRILQRGTQGVATALHWDPVAVRFCREAGEGARLDLRIGGKVGPGSGPPIDLSVMVRKIASGITQRFGDVHLPIGEAAWVSVGDVDIVLNTLRTQVFHPECMTLLGIDLAARRLIVVKSTNHFYEGFAPMAARIMHVAAPGALEQRFEKIALTKRKLPYWPKTEEAFAEGPQRDRTCYGEAPATTVAPRPRAPREKGRRV
jgi:microcystin degradation protein MlrC